MALVRISGGTWHEDVKSSLSNSTELSLSLSLHVSSSIPKLASIALSSTLANSSIASLTLSVSTMASSTFEKFLFIFSKP